MTEPLSWLKLGPRARTPTDSLVVNPLECKAARDSQFYDPRRPGSSRMPASNSPEIELEPMSTSDNADNHHLLVRDQDQVWYNPSLSQMVEALQVQLMQRGLLEPIPVKYNSYISYLIEGFSSAQVRIRKEETAHRETKQSLEQNLEQFRQTANYWLERESQYRAEVKRLEVLLSKCSGSGLEAVALARTNSMVDSSGSEGAGLLSRLNAPGESHSNGPFESKRPPGTVAQISLLDMDQVSRVALRGSQPRQVGSASATSGHERIPTPRILDNENDFYISQKLRQQDATTRAVAGHRDGLMHRRRQFSQPEPDVMNRYNDGFYNPLVNIQDGPITTAVRQGRQSSANLVRQYEEPAGRLEEYCRQGDHSKSPGELAPGLLAYLKGSVNNCETTTATRHKRMGSEFSFEAGDDLDPIQNTLEAEERESVESYLVHKDPEIPTTEAHRSYSSNTDEVTTVFAAAKEPTPPMENNSSVTQSSVNNQRIDVLGPSEMSIRQCRDSVRSNRSLDPLLVTAAAGQEPSQRQNAETDARIAATLALANILGTTKQKRQ